MVCWICKCHVFGLLLKISIQIHVVRKGQRTTTLLIDPVSNCVRCHRPRWLAVWASPENIYPDPHSSRPCISPNFDAIGQRLRCFAGLVNASCLSFDREYLLKSRFFEKALEGKAWVRRSSDLVPSDCNYAHHDATDNLGPPAPITCWADMNGGCKLQLTCDSMPSSPMACWTVKCHVLGLARIYLARSSFFEKAREGTADLVPSRVSMPSSPMACWVGQCDVFGLRLRPI